MWQDWHLCNTRVAELALVQYSMAELALVQYYALSEYIGIPKTHLRCGLFRYVGGGTAAIRTPYKTSQNLTQNYTHAVSVLIWLLLCSVSYCVHKGVTM